MMMIASLHRPNHTVAPNRFVHDLLVMRVSPIYRREAHSLSNPLLPFSIAPFARSDSSYLHHFIDAFVPCSCVCNLFKISCVSIHRKLKCIHKIFVRPKYLHRRTIYCFDVCCCVGYYAKRLAHIYTFDIRIKILYSCSGMPEQLLLFTYQKFC